MSGGILRSLCLKSIKLDLRLMMQAIGLLLLNLTQTNRMFNVETDFMKTPADLGIHPVLNAFQTKKRFQIIY